MSPSHAVTSKLPAGLKFAWYGDDFTGASDTLATLAEAGLRAKLFLDVPTAAQLHDAGELDAIGIAGAARSMTSGQMQRALAPVARFFADAGAPILHYKCCSTFDSSPQVGSIGQAVRMLRAALGSRPALIVGGQPGLARYCAFGQLFAAAGQGGEVHRIDRHPTMSRHPVTPMDEADLRAHLGRQGLAPIGLLDLRAYEEQPARIGAQFDGLLASDEAPAAVLMDVVRESQLAQVGRLLWRCGQHAPVLCVGASSVAQALIDHWGLPRQRHAPDVAPARGPVFVMAGSMSPLSARQITAARSYLRVPLDARRLVDAASGHAETVAAQIAEALRAGRHVLAHSSPLPGELPAPPVDAEFHAALAAASATLLKRVLAQASVTRLGVAGGDTSSHALQALAPVALDWMGRVAPGVALCRLCCDDAAIDGLEVMLKGGQMGHDELFETLLHGTAPG